ncbi:MAG: glycosyltransferase [Candidatus Eisenbacteria bacterium]|uniref:Glycosyltransferase n=1 Tax=Eiseniibacteriota bacterium TaxID=2212470 RepID=A0A956M0P3_UNCEI|nr:glycosyltransferase [Candidatus Eisenbacteria bacterium]
MKIALVHDWLTGMRGGEKVLESICQRFPGAPIYTLVHVPRAVSEVIESHPIHTSFIQKLPWAKSHYQRYLPLFPTAIERFDLRDYDLIISTSHCVAKGVVVHPGSIHLCYCHTPMRYVWSAYEEYFGGENGGSPVSAVMPFVATYLRQWDVTANQRVDGFAANSNHVKRRIERYYGRKARVIHPPCDVDFFTPGGNREDFYLIVTALVPYKRIDLVLEAARRVPRPIVVVGDGVEKERLAASAPPGVVFRGWLEPEELRDLFRRCRALLFPGEEDFGIVPVEAQACGAPVIGLGRGGLLETVRDGESGVFFSDPTPEALLDAFSRFEETIFDSGRIREGVLKFSPERFDDEIDAWIEAEGPVRGPFAGPPVPDSGLGTSPLGTLE